ncbi:MCP four helix bundle domain-containing protein [Paludibaculum fermentans]|uniref:MCP four helix bundle domain-containing protein n=1 Tax=Paludibaculum fermentans TaxID=1473598 RepID=UPI003EBDE120
MKWLNDRHVRTKLMISFVIVAAVAGVIGWVGYSGLRDLEARSQTIYADRLVPIRDLGYANAAFLLARTEVWQMLGTNDKAKRREHVAAIEAESKRIEGYIEAYGKTVLVPEEQEILPLFIASYAQYVKQRAKIIDFALNGQDAKAWDVVYGAALPTQAEARKLMRKLIDINARVGEEEQKAATASAAAATKRIIAIIFGGIAIALFLGYILSRVIGTPLVAMQHAAEKLAAGDVDVHIDLDTNDELGALARAFRSMAAVIRDRADLAQQIAAGNVDIEVKASSDKDLLGKSFIQVVDTLRRLIAEADALAKAAVAGQLATRGNAEQFQGGYKQIVAGVNQTLDAVIGPLNVSAEYMDRISKGDLPPKITDSYNGDFNEIKNNLNNCIGNIKALVDDAGMLVGAAVEGRLATRADATRHQGDYRRIVEGVNQTLDAVIGPLNMSAEYMDRISKGDLPPKITDNYNGDFNEIKINLNKCIDNIKALVSDAGMLVNAAVDGRLATRADASRHQGDYRRIVEGVNQTLDAVIGPLNVAAEYVDRISKGDLPPKITDNYNGDFNEIKINLNNCIDNIKAMVADAGMLVKAAEDGKFATRADAGKHRGDFRKVVEGVNATLDVVVDKVNWYQAIIDAVPSPIHVIDKDMKWVFLNRAFEVLMVKNNIIRSREEAPGMPCSSARANICKTDNCGLVQLSKGVGETYFDWNGQKCKQESSRITNAKGEHIGFVEVVQDLTGIVKAKDYTSHEVARVAANLVQISKGDMAVNLRLAESDEFTAEAKAQFAKINDSLTVMVDAIRAVTDDSTKLVTAAVEGQLSVRADASRHQGDFRKIVEGVNQTLDAIIAPMQESSAVLSRIAQSDLTARVQGNYRGDHARLKDDIGRMAQDLHDSIRSFSQNTQTVASSAEQLTAVSHQMAGNAEETATQANVVASASDEVSRNVTAVAAGAEQMQASIREIAKNANEAARVARNAVSAAHTTNETVNKLGDSSQEIGKVIKVITSIAQQTNLLALNATIEAARAGEAGKGFAVVANEVKELAKQTAKATEEIGGKIEAIQADTKEAVKAIGDIGAIINQINDISNSIASAVEEQTVTTNEIGRSVHEAAKGTNAIASNISGVAEAAKSTTKGATETQRAAAELSRMAAQLQGVVSKYRF